MIGKLNNWLVYCMFCGLDIKILKIIFQEITKTAIMKSLQNIQHINMNRKKSTN